MEDEFTTYDMIYQFLLEDGRVQNIWNGLKISKILFENTIKAHCSQGTLDIISSKIFVYHLSFSKI